jgi:tyrosine-specific transport protein
MNFKLIGSVLMLLGTCTGAGMLALPLATARYDCSTAFIFLGSCWVLMTLGAFALLEAHLWMPCGSNLFTLSHQTLGRVGNLFSLMIYLLLLYSLIAAYIAGCSDLFSSFLGHYGVVLEPVYSTCFAFGILFSVITFGIQIIDITNRLLMLLKFSAFLAMLLLMLGQIAPHTPLTEAIPLAHALDIHGIINSLFVMITALGFAIILPSLRDYLNNNTGDLSRVLSIGCFIPLILYSLWIFSVRQLVPTQGPKGLIAAAQATYQNTALITAISTYAGKSTGTLLIQISRFFISICAITSFLGVSICLVDFIRDTLQHSFKTKTPIILVYCLAFTPPLGIVLVNPGIFIAALAHAGIYVLIFLVLLPFIMLYRGRYHLGYVGKHAVPGGKAGLTLLIVLTSMLLCMALIWI